ncbi:MAG: trypsin-like peptidase domain-containing protein [Clostridiales bacterium]|nr:trypsin-like peptidase domain-containing protein [Clostridiales bacterium]
MDSVVRIYVFHGTTLKYGTGFFINGNRIVTCAHVIAPDGVNCLDRVWIEFVYFINGKLQTSRRVYCPVIAFDGANDIAVLEGDKWTTARGTPLPIDSEYTPEIGETLFFKGFPKEAWEEQDVVFTGMTDVMVRQNDGTYKYYSDTVSFRGLIYGGASGGPVLNADGSIIGINMSTCNGTGMAYAINAGRLQALLDSLDSKSANDAELDGAIPAEQAA